MAGKKPVWKIKLDDRDKRIASSFRTFLRRSAKHFGLEFLNVIHKETGEEYILIGAHYGALLEYWVEWGAPIIKRRYFNRELKRLQSEKKEQEIQ